MKKQRLIQIICNSIGRIADTLAIIHEKLDERYTIYGQPVCSIPSAPGHPYKESLYVDRNGKGECCGCYILIEKQYGKDSRRSWETIPVNGDIEKLKCFYERVLEDHDRQSESYGDDD